MDGAHDLSWRTCGSHWSPGSGISAAARATAGRGGGVAPEEEEMPGITAARYCCPASEREDGGGGGAPEAGVPMREGSWLLGLGGRMGGVGA